MEVNQDIVELIKIKQVGWGSTRISGSIDSSGNYESEFVVKRKKYIYVIFNLSNILYNIIHNICEYFGSI